MAIEERRRYPRVELRIEDGFFGHFILADEESLVTPIINLSASGINLAVSQEGQDRINEGDNLMLNHIVGGANITFIKEIKAEVRWIKSLDLPGYVSAGCVFRDLSDQIRQQLIQFVDAERITRGQYD